jgi:hypothetical protein
MEASLIDAVREITYALAMANRDPKKKAPARPEPVYRPEKTTGKKKQNQFAAMARAAFAAAQRRKE